MGNGLLIPWEALTIIGGLIGFLIIQAQRIESRLEARIVKLAKEHNSKRETMSTAIQALAERVVILETEYKNLKETSERQYHEIVSKFETIFDDLKEIKEAVHKK